MGFAAFNVLTDSVGHPEWLVAHVRAPALLLAGDEDNMTPFRPAPSGIGMAHVAEQLPHCETHVLQSCGHYLVIEQPERASELIADFLSRER